MSCVGATRPCFMQNGCKNGMKEVKLDPLERTASQERATDKSSLIGSHRFPPQGSDELPLA